jgi:EpsI family protein
MPESNPSEHPKGSLLSRRNFFMGAAMLATSGIAFARQPTVHNPVVKPDKFESWVPKAFGPWSMVASSGVVLPAPDALSDRLYDNLVTRVYSSPEAAVMMLLAYNNQQDGMLQVHRPEVCYPVGGFRLTETERLSIPALGRQVPANVFTATASDRTEQVVYFTRLGDAYPRSWAEQRLAVVEENLAGRVPDGMMMRVSLLGTDRQAALEVLRGFIGDFATSAAAPLQRLLVV